jgi:hypothetical protein
VHRERADFSDEELSRVTDFIKEQVIPVEYSDAVTNVAQTKIMSKG